MKEVIEQLKALNLEEATENDIVQIMHKAGRAGGIITTYHPAYGSGAVPNIFVRASNYDPKSEQISSTDRLRYPPLKFNTDYQRASTPKMPMFYATRYKSPKAKDSMSAIRTCLLETIDDDDYDKLVFEGKRVAISLRYNIMPINLFSVFNWDEFQSKNPEHAEVIASFNESIKQLSTVQVENTRLILDYLSDRFHIPVGKNANLYKPSAILTQYLLEKLNQLDVDGVVFPSTKVLGQEINVALIPVKSDDKLVVTKVLDCEYKPNKIVEIQRRAIIEPGSKNVNFSEMVKIDIDLK